MRLCVQEITGILQAMVGRELLKLRNLLRCDGEFRARAMNRSGRVEQNLRAGFNVSKAHDQRRLNLLLGAG
jgi:hypothetical protein